MLPHPPRASPTGITGYGRVPAAPPRAASPPAAPRPGSGAACPALPAIPGQEPLPTRVEPRIRTEPPAETRSTGTDSQPRPSGVPAGSGKGQGPFRQGQHGRHSPPFKPRYRAAARRRPAASPQAGLPVPCRPGPSPRPARRAHSPGPPGAHPGAGRRARSSARPGPGTPWRHRRHRRRRPRRARFRRGVRGGTRHSPAPPGLAPPCRSGRPPHPSLCPASGSGGTGLVGTPAPEICPGAGGRLRAKRSPREGQRQNHPALPGQQEVSLPPWDSLNFSLHPSSPAPGDVNHGSCRVTELLALFQSPWSLQVPCYDAQQSTDGVLEGSVVRKARDATAARNWSTEQGEE